MQVTIDTISFYGTGSITCRDCGVRSIYPSGCTVIVYSFAHGRRVIIDAKTGARFHDCLVTRSWICQDCGKVQHVRHRRNEVLAICVKCRGPLRQVEDVIIKPSPPPIPMEII